MVRTNCINEPAAETSTEAFKEPSSRHTSLPVDESASPVKYGSFRDKSASLSRKKTRKVRLMTELLAKDGSPATNVSSVPLAIRDASVDVSVRIQSPDSRKRKSTDLVDKATSDSVEHIQAEVAPLVGKKRQKKKNKVVHESSSEEPFEESYPVDIARTEKSKGPINMSSLKIDQNSSKKKNKRLQDGSFTYWNDSIPKEGQISTLKNKKNMKGGSVAAPLQSVQQNAPSDQGLTMQRCRESGPQLTGGPVFSEVDQFNRQGELNAFFQRSEFPFINVSQIEGVRDTDSGGPSNRLTTNEIQESSTLPRRRDDQRSENDDVLEIAELMAKNQFERCLPDGDSEKQPANNTQRAQLVDLNEEYVGGQEDNNIQRRESQKNGQNAAIINKEKTVDYLSCIDTNHFKVSHLNKSTFTSSGLIRPFCQYPETPSRGMHCFPSNLNRQVNAQNSQWTGNVLRPPASHYGFSYSVSEGTPQKTEALNRNWPTMYPNHMPYLYNAVGNFDGNGNLTFRNPSGSGVEKKRQNFDSEVLGKKHAGYPFACKLSGKKSSSDLFSNDAMSALHLLSLMDGNLPTGATFDGSGPPSLFQRPSFPYHNTVMPTTNDNAGRSPISHNFNHGHFSTAGGFAIPFQHGKIHKNATNIMNQVSLEPRGKGKAKDFLAQNRGGTPLQFPAISNPALFTEHSVLENVNKQQVAPSSSNATAQPPKSSVLCTINRNPADFSIPEAGNEFMIAGEDLKLRKPMYSENRAGSVRLDGAKRKKKTTVPKEPDRHKMP
ncbi:hypothetical protein ACFE04_018837 [Oxalis oulophora]